MKQQRTLQIYSDNENFRLADALIKHGMFLMKEIPYGKWFPTKLSEFLILYKFLLGNKIDSIRVMIEINLMIHLMGILFYTIVLDVTISILFRNKVQIILKIQSKRPRRYFFLKIVVRDESSLLIILANQN